MEKASEKDKAYQLSLIAKYREPLEPYFRYMPWFLERKNKNLEKFYDGDEISGTFSFPVYESTLLNFVQGIQTTGLIDRNYPYLYSKYGLHSTDEELALIERCGLAEVADILAVVSKYVLGGMTKGRMWNEAVEYGIFYHALARIRDILNVYSDTHE